MKKNLFRLLLCLTVAVLASCSSDPNEWHKDVYYVDVKADSHLSLREKPTKNSKLVDKLYKDTEVCKTGEEKEEAWPSPNTWIEVNTTDGKTGWVLEAHIRRESVPYRITNEERFERNDQPATAFVMRYVEKVYNRLSAIKAPALFDPVSLIYLILTAVLWFWVRKDDRYRFIHYALLVLIYAMLDFMQIVESPFMNPDPRNDGEAMCFMMLLSALPLWSVTEELTAAVLSARKFDASALVAFQMVIAMVLIIPWIVCFTWWEEYTDIAFYVFIGAQALVILDAFVKSIKHHNLKGFLIYLFFFFFCIIPLVLGMIYGFLGAMMVLIILNLFAAPFMARGKSARKEKIYEIVNSAGLPEDETDNEGKSIRNGTPWDLNPNGTARRRY